MWPYAKLRLDIAASEPDALRRLQQLCDADQFSGTVSRESIALTPFFFMSRNGAPPVFRGRIVSSSATSGTYIELRAELHPTAIVFSVCWILFVAPLAFRFHERGQDFPFFGLWFLAVIPLVLLVVFMFESSIGAERLRRATGAV
jgi:hypothetical protein